MDRRTELSSHLARLDAALDEAAPSEVASLLRERRITLNEIGESAAEGSVRDELKRKRDARRKRTSAAAASST